MSPMINSQKMPNELYKDHSRITSYDNPKLNMGRQNISANNTKLINTLGMSDRGYTHLALNKSTISAKQSKKVLQSLGTLGLYPTVTNLAIEQENIEEMHTVLVAFYRVAHGMLNKVEFGNSEEDKVRDPPSFSIAS